MRKRAQTSGAYVEGTRRESTIATLSCTIGQVDGNAVATCIGGKWTPDFGMCVIPLQSQFFLFIHCSLLVPRIHSFTSVTECASIPTPVGGALQYSNGAVEVPCLSSMNCTAFSGTGTFSVRDARQVDVRIVDIERRSDCRVSRRWMGRREWRPYWKLWLCECSQTLHTGEERRKHKYIHGA